MAGGSAPLCDIIPTCLVGVVWAAISPSLSARSRRETYFAGIRSFEWAAPFWGLLLELRRLDLRKSHALLGCLR